MRLVQRGFTIVEMLVVIGVISLLMGLLMPIMSSIRAESKSTQCLANLRQIFVALQTARAQQQDLLPFAAPLPVPPGQIAVVPGLPEKLNAIMPSDAETWLCPADDSVDAEELRCSYTYAPGAFMMMLPPLLPDLGSPLPTLQQQMNRAMRVITTRYDGGDLAKLPLIADTQANHGSGSRNPRNAVFIDGTARVMRPGDDLIEQEAR